VRTAGFPASADDDSHWPPREMAATSTARSEPRVNRRQSMEAHSNGLVEGSREFHGAIMESTSGCRPRGARAVASGRCFPAPDIPAAAIVAASWRFPSGYRFPGLYSSRLLGRKDPPWVSFSRGPRQLGNLCVTAELQRTDVRMIAQRSRGGIWRSSVYICQSHVVSRRNSRRRLAQTS